MSVERSGNLAGTKSGNVARAGQARQPQPAGRSGASGVEDASACESADTYGCDRGRLQAVELRAGCPSLCWPSAGRRGVDAGAAMGEGEGGHRHAELPSMPSGGAWRWTMPRACELRVGQRLPIGARTRGAGTWRGACRNASHSSAVRVEPDLRRAAAISRSWSASRSSLVRLDHVGGAPAPSTGGAAGADCWRPASHSAVPGLERPVGGVDARLPWGLGCTPLRR